MDGRVRIDDGRNPAALKGEFDLRLLIIESRRAEPGFLEIGFFNWRAEFCNESLHPDYLVCDRPLNNNRLSPPALVYFIQVQSRFFRCCAFQPETVYYGLLCGETKMTQSFTFIDPGGNQAQYTVYEADYRNQYHWSTDHGDSGFDGSYAQAQTRARTALKVSMAARRRSDRHY
jgi:hypothetical protein